MFTKLGITCFFYQSGKYLQLIGTRGASFNGERLPYAQGTTN